MFLNIKIALEQEIEMDNRYNEWNIVISILCILLCFSIIGLIIYFMYIYISPPIGNDPKEIFKTISTKSNN